MPRKKTVQPEPIETIVEDGLIIEVYDDNDYEICRGSHKVHEFERRCWRVIESIIDEYVQAHGVIADSNTGPLKSAAALDMHIQLNGILPEITDSGAIRKRIYPHDKDHVDMLIQLKS